MESTKAMNREFIQSLLKWLMILFVFMPFLSTAQTVPAYTIITNQATVVYYNDELNLYERVDSNVVKVMVAAVPSLILTQNETVIATVGQEVTIAHQLTNTGNVPLIPTLSWEFDTGSNFTLMNFKLYLDLNNNGIADSGDPIFTSGAALPILGVNQTYQLLIAGNVPSTVSVGNVSLFALMATGLGEKGETSNNSTVNDKINVSNVSGLTLFKSANVVKASPASPIIYNIVATQAGGSDTTPAYLDIDGVNQSKVFIRDVIPRGTYFSSINKNSGAQVLYHIIGTSTDNYYQSTPPANLNSVDAIAFAWDTFPTGAARDVSFTVNTIASLNQNVSNQAAAYQTIDGVQTKTKSNTVVLTPTTMGNINFYENDSYTNLSALSQEGVPLYIAATAQSCNADSNIAESYSIEIMSEVAGDFETFARVVETGPDTGLFTLVMPTERWDAEPVVDNNTILSVATNDTVTVVLNCQGNTYTNTHEISPSGRGLTYTIEGTLFNSRNTNRAISNATVEIYTTTSSADGVLVTRATDTPVLFKTTTSDNNGRYKFIGVPKFPGKNYLIIARVDNHTYPSVYSASIFLNHQVHPVASYKLPFNFADFGTYSVDIPVDYLPPSGQGLTISKEVNKEHVQYGQTLTYTINYINNVSTVSYDAVELTDILPRGFSFVPGTAKRTITKSPASTSLIGVKTLADPVGAPGRDLTFELGLIGGSEEGSITYQVQVRNSAPVGKAVNVAQLVIPGHSNEDSNTASATVYVEGGVFSDEAFILGTVFADCNNNKQKDPDEQGVPFVRMYLEDGTYVISDSEGRFSLYGLTPRTHIMKVDNTTLPVGAKLEVLNNRFAKDASSAFADLKKGELHRTDFAISNCTAEIIQEIEKRRGTWQSDEVSTQLQTISDSSLGSLEPFKPGDLKARPAQGTVKGNGTVASEVIALPGTNVMAPYLQDDMVNKVSAITGMKGSAELADIEEVIKTTDNKIGFLDLKDGDVLASPQLTVRIKGSMGVTLALRVNGKDIDVKRVGQRSTLQSQNIEVWNYIGVNLTAGKNELEAHIIDSFGNTRESKKIHVTAPGDLDKIIIKPVREAVADGITPLPVLVRLVDKNGLNVFGRSTITLETTSGRWDVANSKTNSNGSIDILLENGEGVVNLITPEPGRISLRVTSGLLKQVEEIKVSPNLRPLIAVGVIEGAIGLRDLKDGSIEGISNGDNFEQTIRTAFGTEGKAGAVGLRGAMFLKGKVKGDYLLTLAYDSDKKSRGEMFRDIDPNKYYPIYGDDSIKGFDAQATSELYVRIDKGNSFMLYGDYSTEENSFKNITTVKGKSLGRYQRNFTGLKGQYENDRVRVTYFAAYHDSQQKVFEIEGRGISGPYDVNMGDFVKNSEVVTILTRSRAQPSLIIKREELKRHTDYTFDAFYNTILFKRPIPSIDENGNPVSFQITYEVEEGGDKFWVYGGDGDVRITDMISIGGSYVEDKDPGTRYRLASAHTVFDITPNIGLALEWAKSRGIEGSSKGNIATTVGETQTGQAYRAEFVANSEDKRFESRTYITKADASFINDNGGVTAGREDAGTTLSYRAAESTMLHAEGLYTKDTDTGTNTSGSERFGGLFSVEQSLTSGFAGRLGTRYVKEKNNNESENDDVTSIFARIMWTPESYTDLRTFIEGEQSVKQNSRNMVAAGAEYALNKQISMYGRHEFISKLGLGSTNSAHGQFGMSGNSGDSRHNATTLGMKYNYATDSEVFSEYRIVNAINGREAEGSIGVNNGWELADGLRMNTTFERIQPFNGQVGIASAATLGFDYTANENWKGTTRFEWRRSASQQSWLHTLGLAYKLNKDWTALASNIYGYESSLEHTGDRRRDDARIGMAYRDTATNRMNALMRYQLLIDDNGKESSNYTRHVVAGLANYQLNPDLIISGRYAISRNNNNEDSVKTNATTQLVMARFTYDLAEDWDIGLMGSRLFGNSASQSGYGAEVGYLLGKNIWLSSGYNFVGFRDSYLTGSDYTQQGAYIRLRVKFDESMFGWLTE